MRIACIFSAAVPFAVASAVIHIGYDLALMNSYRRAAFNQVYPIARGTSPLVVALGAYVLVGERLSPVALAGVVILAAGLASLALSAGRVTRSELPAVTAAVITGLVIAGPRAAGRGRRDQGDERGVRGADRDADVRRALRATRLAAAALVAAGIVLISA